MSNQIFERMARFYVDNVHVRLWIGVSSLEQAAQIPAEAYRKIAVEVRAKVGLDPDWNALKEIAAALSKAPFVNAVEVTNIHGDGLLVYNDWP